MKLHKLMLMLVIAIRKHLLKVCMVFACISDFSFFFISIMVSNFSVHGPFFLGFLTVTDLISLA